MFSSSKANSNSVGRDYFSTLPTELLVAILDLTCLTYEQTAALRLVSQSMNEVCSSRLNAGLKALQKRSGEIHSQIKARQPKRESERNGQWVLFWHELNVRSISNGLSGLARAYKQFMEAGLCCVIAGRVLDEGNRVLTVIDTAARHNQRGTGTLSKEFKDLCTMATDHFESVVEPGLKLRLDQMEQQNDGRSVSHKLVPLQNTASTTITGGGGTINTAQVSVAPSVTRPTIYVDPNICVDLAKKVKELQRVNRAQQKQNDAQQKQIDAQQKQINDLTAFVKVLNERVHVGSQSVPDDHDQSMPSPPTTSGVDENLRAPEPPVPALQPPAHLQHKQSNAQPLKISSRSNSKPLPRWR